MGRKTKRTLKYTETGSIQQSQIAEVVQKEVEEYFKKNNVSYLQLSKGAISTIDRIYNKYLKNALKELDEPIEKVLDGVYSESYGYGNVIQKYEIAEEQLEKTLKNVYEAINKLSAIIRNKPEVDYIINFRVSDDEGNEEYFSMKVNPDQITDLYTINLTEKSIEGLTSLNKITELLGFQNKKELLNKTKAQELYYQHMKKFMNTVRTAFYEEQAKRKSEGLKYHKDFNYGFAYEAFSWHLKHFKEEPIYENGLIKSWKQGHPYMPKKASLLKGYFASIGNAKFSSGGDVENTQLKSVQLKMSTIRKTLKITSSFGVASYNQLLNSINLLLINLKGKDKLNKEEVSKLILAFNDIQNDAAITTYNKLTLAVDNAIDSIFESLQGDPNISISST